MAKHRKRPRLWGREVRPRFYVITSMALLATVAVSCIATRPVPDTIAAAKATTQATPTGTITPLPVATAKPTVDWAAIVTLVTPSPTEEPTPTPWWTADDLALLAAVISAEARGQEYEGQLAVGCVALNRLEHGRWGDTLEDVLTAKAQFAKPHWEYPVVSLQAAKECLEGTRVLPANIYYFQQKQVDYWKTTNSHWYATIGDHNFYRRDEF